MPLRDRAFWALAVILSVTILIAPAIWNGFPLLQYDTGGYLASWYEGTLVPSRAVVYGLILTLGVPLSFWPVLLLQSGLSWGGGRHHDGGQLELGVTSGIPLGDDLIGISLAATYANAAQLRGSFGLRPSESHNSGLPTWQPSSGWQDWSIALSAEHKFSEDWSVSGQWQHARLIDQAAASPLTHSRDQPSFIVSLWHRF